jgi:hypothetical protein
VSCLKCDGIHSASERSLLVGLKKDSRFRRVQFVVVNATRDLISIEGSLQPLNKDVVNDIPIRAAFIQTTKKSKDGKSKAVTTMAMRSHRGVFDSSSLTSFLVSCTDDIKDEGKDAFVSIKQAPWLRKRPKPKAPTSSSASAKDKSDDTSEKKSSKKKETSTASEKKTTSGDKEKKTEKLKSLKRRHQVARRQIQQANHQRPPRKHQSRYVIHHCLILSIPSVTQTCTFFIV